MEKDEARGASNAPDCEEELRNIALLNLESFAYTAIDEISLIEQVHAYLDSQKLRSHV
jgi:hypothetical protein